MQPRRIGPVNVRAVRGNAGAMGLDIARSISKVEVWRNGEILEVASADCQFGYRESIFKNQKFIGVDFALNNIFAQTPGTAD